MPSPGDFTALNCALRGLTSVGVRSDIDTVLREFGASDANIERVERSQRDSRKQNHGREKRCARHT